MPDGQGAEARAGRLPAGRLCRALPNLISLLRLLLVPVVVALLADGTPVLAVALFVLVGLLDAVDGWLARRLGAETRLGRYLDPVADKVLAVAICVTLGWLGWLPSWLVILIVSRDLLIMGGVLVLTLAGGTSTLEPLPLEPLAVSKLNTAVQVTLMAVCMAANTFAPSWAPLAALLVWLAAATTVASGAGYVYVWGRRAILDANSNGGGNTP